MPFHHNTERDEQPYESNMKLNSFDSGEDLIDQYKSQDHEINFNGFSIDYQRERRKTTNPYAAIQSQRVGQSRSFQLYKSNRN